MSAYRLDDVELEVLDQAIRDVVGGGYDTTGIVATVEAILLARRLSQELRAQPAGTPIPRLRAAPPGETYTTSVNQPGTGRVLHLRHAKT